MSHIFYVSSSKGLEIEGCRTCWKDELGNHTLTCSTCLEGQYRKDLSGAHPCRAIDSAWEPRITSPGSLKAITHSTWSKIGSPRSRWNRGTEYYRVATKTHIEYHDIFFRKYNCPYHIEMGTYIIIDLLWASGSVAPAQLTSLRWNWGIFAKTRSTCLEGPHRKDSSGLRSPNTFPVQSNGYTSCYRIQNREFSVPLE